MGSGIIIWVIHMNALEQNDGMSFQGNTAFMWLFLIKLTDDQISFFDIFV